MHEIPLPNRSRLLLPAGARLFSEQLTARAARLARAVADVVDGAVHSDPGGVAAAAFLRDWADSTAPVVPVAGQPFDRVSERFDLRSAERDLLLLAGVPDEHEGLASTFRAIHPHGEPRPTAGLAALVLAGAGVDRAELRLILTAGAAVHHRLLQLTGSGTLFERSLVLADGLCEALHGSGALPATLRQVPVGDPPAGLDGWLDDARVRPAARTLQDGVTATVLVGDSDETVALGRVTALARSVGVGLVAARITGEAPDAIPLLAAHAAALDAVPLIMVERPAYASPSQPVDLAVRDLPGPVIVCAGTGTVRLGPDRPLVTLPVDPVAAPGRRAAWRVAFPVLSDNGAATLAARHPIDPALIAQVALDARVGADAQPGGHQNGRADGWATGVRPGTGHLDPQAVASLIRRRAGVSLPPGVQLVTPAVPWHRLVLPAQSGLQLRDAVSRLEHEAVVLDDWNMRERARATRGARLLFTGPPGTGKSLAAEAVASAVGTDLLRVDTSQVVSKWIGETEKNLGAAFDVAERTQGVLFLDEADALFGTRTEISDAHDRYANLETAYLLQRLDRFEGLAVLATNLRHNVDPAFVRRMDFVVEFPLPELPERRELWALHLPPQQTCPDVDADTLARLYPIPGGWIRNAAVGAAFVAAAAGEHIRMPHLVSAVRREYAKAALPFPGEPPRRSDDI